MPTEMLARSTGHALSKFRTPGCFILVALADANDMRLDAAQDKTLARAARFALSTYLHRKTSKRRQAFARSATWIDVMDWPLSASFQASERQAGRRACPGVCRHWK